MCLVITFVFSLPGQAEPVWWFLFFSFSYFCKDVYLFCIPSQVELSTLFIIVICGFLRLLMNAALFCETLWIGTQSDALKLCSVKTLLKSYQTIWVRSGQTWFLFRYSIWYGSCSLRCLCYSVMLNVFFSVAISLICVLWQYWSVFDFWA